MAKQRRQADSSVQAGTCAPGASPLCLWASSTTLMRPSHATELAGWQQLTLVAGERVSVVGCAHARCERGSAWMHGHRLAPGGEALLRSLPDVGSTTVLEGGHDGAVVALRALVDDGATAAENASALRVTTYADAAAAGHATIVTQARRTATCHAVRNSLVASQEWRDACNAIAAQAASGLRVCAVVCGPKGAGKSTLTRLLVNTLQSATKRAVGLLDADCGAPEVTPPGVLSLSLLDQPLLGAPAARLGAPDAPAPLECRFIGDISPASDPAAYAAAVHSLLAVWGGAGSPAAAHTALVINTMGWVRGLGLELLAELLRGCSPTHVLYVRASGSTPDDRSAGVPRALFWALQACSEADASAPPCRVLELAAAPRVAVAEPGGVPDAAQQMPQRRSATDARALLWAAWACAACEPAAAHRWAMMLAPGGAGEAAAFAYVAAALAAAKPYSVPISSVRCRLLHGAVPADDALRVLNGALVALVAEVAAGSRCLGLGLVRSVDASAGVLHLLTPLPPGLASTVTTLVVGRLELPAALLTAPLHASPYLTAWALAQEGSGGAAMRSRNNLQRGTATFARQ